jgi:cysteinyl-tRNA synthetase
MTTSPAPSPASPAPHAAGASLAPRDPFTVSIHNTRSRRVEPIEPLSPGRAGIYTCGPTVYAAQHIGNMRSQLFADLLRRALTASGLDVTHVINITDVGHLTSNADEGEDKLEVAAARAGQTAMQIAEKYTAQWQHDRSRLGCLEPSVLCKATDHIDEMIEMVRAIEAAGHTYRTDDGIYFDTTTFSHYTDLTGQRLEDLETTGRVENVEQKRHPADFALWKFSPLDVQRQQEWDSPWGRGFPGWHIECSAMSTKYLGQQFDIHTGGVDHIAVHHTNEIAQSETALHLHPWVPYWVHHEFLRLGADKMSKSTGKTLVLDDLVADGFDPLTFRFFILQAHYRQQQDFSLDALRAAQTALRNYRRRAAEARDAAGSIAGLVELSAQGRAERDRFWAAVADDLNAPRAVAVAFDVVKNVELTPAERWALVVDFDDFLGLDIASATQGDVDVDALPGDVQSLIDERAAARAGKDWARADALRDEITALGYELLDTAEGQKVRRADG